MEDSFCALGSDDESAELRRVGVQMERAKSEAKSSADDDDTSLSNESSPSSSSSESSSDSQESIAENIDPKDALAETRVTSSHSIDSLFADAAALNELDRQIELHTIKKTAAKASSPPSSNSQGSPAASSVSMQDPVYPKSAEKTQQFSTNNAQKIKPLPKNKSSNLAQLLEESDSSLSLSPPIRRGRGRPYKPSPSSSPSSPSNSQDSSKPPAAAKHPAVENSSEDDSFGMFTAQELAAIDRRVKLRTKKAADTSHPQQNSKKIATTGVPQEITQRSEPKNDDDSLKNALSQDPYWDSFQSQEPSFDDVPVSSPANSAEKDIFFQESTLPMAQEASLPVEQDKVFEMAFGFCNEEYTPSLNQKEQGEPSEDFVNEGDSFQASSQPDDAIPIDTTNDTLDGENGIEPEERVSEIHPSFYAPPSRQQPRRPPIVHTFSLANRPVNTRRLLPVSQVFRAPVNSMWTNKFDTFNQLQSEIANTLAYSDDNVVVSAPTGAGKTAVFEMAMARFFDIDLQSQPSQLHGTSRHISRSRKIVYISPSKALCEERFEDWSTRLAAMNLGLEVAVVTGDGDPSAAFRDLASAHLVLTTPEKWDSLTRRWTESFFLFGSVKLFLVDEVHLIADESRGCCLESILCRMKAIQRGAQSIQVTQADIQVSSYTNTTPEAFNSLMRVVAVSATLPNIGEIASFLDANEAHTFDDSYRPVPLKIHVIGQGYIGGANTNQFRFWSALDRNVPDIIQRFSKKKPALVFCHSKNDTEKLADMLAMENGIGSKSKTSSEMASRTRVSKLQRVLFHGIAYHHAGLEVDDRRLVEKSFIEGKIRVLCATSTLAMGVNLPAHLVLIKGTKAWRGGGLGYQDLEQASLLQMIGRAGRPGFDTSGTAVIMTDNQSKRIFERLASSGLRPAISKLCTKIDEVVNTEISQRVITSTESALDWISGSLFSIQLRNNPSNFGVKDGTSLDEKLFAQCTESIRRLRAIGTLAGGNGPQLFALPASHVMSQHLVESQAMQLFVDTAYDSNQCQILKTLAHIEGLHRPVRRSEKRFLKEAHKSLKYKLDGPPSKVTIQKPFEKAFVLLQVSIGRIHLEDYTLRQEMNSMVDFSSRMLMALEDYSTRGTKNGMVVLESLKLRRSLATNTWNAQEDVLNQLIGIGPSAALSLKFSGISKFEDVLQATDEQLEKAAKRLQPFGSNLRTAVSKILADTLQITARIKYTGESKDPSHVVCELRRRDNVTSLNVTASKNATPQVTYTLLAYTDRPGGCLIYRRNVSSPGCYKAQVPKTFGAVTFHLIASLVGLDEKLELEGNDKVVLSAKPPANARTRTSNTSTGSRRIRSTNNRSTRKKAPQPFTVTHEMSPVGAATSRSRGIRSQVGGSGPNVTPSPRPEVGSPQLSQSTLPIRQRMRVSAAAGDSRLGENAFRSPPLSQSTLPILQRAMASSTGRKARTTHTFCSPHFPHRTQPGSQQAQTVNPDTDMFCSPQPTQPVAQRAQAETSLFREAENAGETSQYDIQSQFMGNTTERLIPPEGGENFDQDYNQASRKHPISSVRKSRGQTSWKKAKIRQQKAQQRAFVFKKDNPFSLYKHDPNDAENYLDNLTAESSVSSSIIPPEGLQALERAYADNAKRFANSARKQDRPGRMMQDRPRPRPRQPSGITVPQVMAQRAAELNYYSSTKQHEDATSDLYYQGQNPGQILSPVQDWSANSRVGYRTRGGESWKAEPSYGISSYDGTVPNTHTQSWPQSPHAAATNYLSQPYHRTERSVPQHGTGPFDDHPSTSSWGYEQAGYNMPQAPADGLAGLGPSISHLDDLEMNEKDIDAAFF